MVEALSNEGSTIWKVGIEEHMQELGRSNRSAGFVPKGRYLKYVYEASLQ